MEFTVTFILLGAVFSFWMFYSLRRTNYYDEEDNDDIDPFKTA